MTAGLFICKVLLSLKLCSYLATDSFPSFTDFSDPIEITVYLEAILKRGTSHSIQPREGG